MSESITKQAWFTKYNPTVFEDIVFPDQEKKDQIKQILDDGMISGNLMSYGRGGVGKTTINKLLLNAIVKTKEDRFILQRNIQSIDELKPWLMRPVIASKQKIIICEEFDLLSSTAMTALKNGLMESFQPKVAFIVTTNKPRKIDPALMRRFNIKLDFDGINIEGVSLRLINILKMENINHDENTIKSFVESNQKMNISDLISTMQACSLTGTFDPNSGPAIMGSNNEVTIANYIDYIVNICLNFRDINGVFSIINNPNNDQEFMNGYTFIVDALQKDPNLNGEYVFDLLEESENLANLAISNVIRSYYQKLYQIKFLDLHLLSMISDIIKTVYELKGGSLIQRDVPLIT